MCYIYLQTSARTIESLLDDADLKRFGKATNPATSPEGQGRGAAGKTTGTRCRPFHLSKEFCDDVFEFILENLTDEYNIRVAQTREMKHEYLVTTTLLSTDVHRDQVTSTLN